MKYRAVSVLEVDGPSRWERLLSVGLESQWLGEHLSPTRRVIVEERPLVEHLGARALIRYARRPPEQQAADEQALAETVRQLSRSARRVLHSAQRHALDGEVVGLHAWDPQRDAGNVRALHGSGLIRIRAQDERPFYGRYRLADDLPPPPTIDYDFDDAIMADEVEDLSAPSAALLPLMHDMAALAAAILQVRPRRTYAGRLMKVDARKLGRRLGAPILAKTGDLTQTPEWGRALQALEALRAVRVGPIDRVLHVDLGLETTLAGETADAVDRLVHRLVDRDQHVLLPAVRAALRQAGAGCVDTVVFIDLLREQHRDIVFPLWHRDGLEVYPHLEGERIYAYDEDTFEIVEGSMILRLLKRLDKLGLVRRAEGVFAGTDDGRLWAGAANRPMAPLWVGSDLELIVPPEAVTPWERFQLERLSKTLARDVVNRYALDREGLAAWLAGHDLSEAIDLLKRRCPGVPSVVIDTLEGWARAAAQIVITRGVLLPLAPKQEEIA
ncbi:MAG: hypothetical protein AAFV53_24900 [Myxococcota bacterium]